MIDKRRRPPDHPEKGRLLYMDEITERTRMPEGTVRSRRHRGRMPCVWKLGRHLVAWERDLDQWLEAEQVATTKTEGSNDGPNKDH